MWADEGLPDIGDDRGHDDDRERLARRHRYREQAHRYRRQAQPDDTLDEAGQQQRSRDENKHGVEHRRTLTDRVIRHNLDLTENAFGYAEVRWKAKSPCVSIWSICSSS